MAPPPAARTGRIAFGSFTRADKIGADVVAVWARVLAAVPRSTLILKGESLKFPEVRQRFERGLSEAGIEPSRLELRPPSSHEDLLAEYADVDLAGSVPLQRRSIDLRRAVDGRAESSRASARA